MNILFLCHRLPYPPNKGEKIRSFNILEHLLKRHTVYLGTFVDEREDYQYLPIVENMLSNRCKIVPLPSWVTKARMLVGLFSGEALSTACFHDGVLQAWTNDLLAGGSIDRVVVFGTAMAPYLIGSRAFSCEHVVFDMVDIDSDKWKQYGDASRGPLRLLYRREARKLFHLEREAAQLFGATLLVSSFERSTFIDLAPETENRVHTALNGVDMAYFSPNLVLQNPFEPSAISIVMTGRMDYRPNVEGAKWFAEKVLPIIRVAIPAARFYVVGAQPPNSLKALRSEYIVVTGLVNDIRPYISHASVVVAPLQMARGVQNKVLEAMSMQRPVVATTPATRALNVVSGKELWIADDPKLFAAAVVQAVTANNSAEIAANARRHVEENYAWDRNLSILDDLLDTTPKDADGHQPGHAAARISLASQGKLKTAGAS